MAESTTLLNRTFDVKRLGAPIVVLAVLAMMVLPLPAFALDVFFTLNIALSLVVLLVALRVLKPMEFSSFPLVLLLTTLLRLALNIASTRVILIDGHTGADSAGKVIEAFGHVLVGDNPAVGIVVFVILVIINFVVITKGAGRIAEVSARFSLDSLPGKQMAIDADLNTGQITHEEARRRRLEISQEADFFGSMDGASKFVRGDAIAAVLIMVINLIGGLVIGIWQHDMSLGDAASRYTLLTIGDGLVAQIPALIISTAAGIVITRVSDEKDVGEQLSMQMFARPEPLYVSAGVLLLLGIIPNMPHTAFLLMALCAAGLGYAVARAQQKQQTDQAVAAAKEETLPNQGNTRPPDVGWGDVVQVDTLAIEVGYRLIPLVDKGQDGELLTRIHGLRRKLAKIYGFLVPPVHIRDNLELRPNHYNILVKGAVVASGELQPDMLLAVKAGHSQASDDLTGVAVKEPVFGNDAIWIKSALKDRAAALGYNVVNSSAVITTHLNAIATKFLHELLSREDVQNMVEHLAQNNPKLIEKIVPEVVSYSLLHRVLQQLLKDGLHVRDMRSIIECLSENAANTKEDIETLTALTRAAISRSIMQSIFGQDMTINLLALHPQLEHEMLQSLHSHNGQLVLEPQRLNDIQNNIRVVMEQVGNALPNTTVALAVDMRLRPRLRPMVSDIAIIGRNEIPDDYEARWIGSIGGEAMGQ